MRFKQITSTVECTEEHSWIAREISAESDTALYWRYIHDNDCRRRWAQKWGVDRPPLSPRVS